MASDGREWFAAGETVVRRDMVRGKVWTAAPLRVVHDRPGGRELLLAHWPGIEARVGTTWIDWLAKGDEAARKQAVPLLVNGGWRLGTWVWRTTAVLSWFGVDENFSVYRFHNVEDGGMHWYVNFERPYRRTRIGIDTFDLLLDLVVAPDLSSWSWKDEDEYAQGRRLGLIGDAEHRRIEQARLRALALIESRGGPFAQDWSDWRVQPDWPLPTLPHDALEVPSGFDAEEPS
jgi:protein associated with RNAse G/E